MASSHTNTVVGNSKQSAQTSSYSTLPFLASRTPSSPYSPSPSPESTSSLVSPHVNFHGIKRSFSHSMHSSRRSTLPLGTLIGGVILFLGTSTAHALSFSFLNWSTPASRMKERLEKHGFTEKIVAPDGNCQMRALSDQIHGDEKYYNDVRSKITMWLSKNEKYTIDDSGSSTLGDFIDTDRYPRWLSYVSHMSRNGTWGDHITLVAASEVYNVQISIISNVDDKGTGQYITHILPRSKKPTKTLNLSHWHEMHYNSLHPIANKAGGREM
jgi:hypothetical protein